jgi:hypothetical protein
MIYPQNLNVGFFDVLGASLRVAIQHSRAPRSVKHGISPVLHLAERESERAIAAGFKDN